MTHPDEYRRWYEDEPKESTLTDDHIDLSATGSAASPASTAACRSRRPSSGRAPVVLDLGCNDWWMGEFLARHGSAATASS
jgi:hypothetical protein